MKKIFLKTVFALTLFAFFSLSFSPLAHAENEDLTKAGDALQFILPAVAGLSTFVAGNPEGGLWDREGTYQFTKSLSFSLATMGVGKQMAEKIRPDASDNQSYPSGHTTAAFAGAGFIDQRYGHLWGVPALLAAGLTAYSRVQSYNHFADDTVAGASIGLMYNWLFVTPQSESSNVAILPMVVNGGAGITLSITDAENTGSKTKRSSYKSPKSRYNFLFGPAFLEKNEITVPSDTGTTFDLANFEKINDPLSTAAIDFEFYINDRNEASLYFSPFESRDRGSFANPVSFAGQIFPANTEIWSDWLLYDLRARWLYNLTPASSWDVKLGAALSYQHIEIGLESASGSLSAEVKDDVFLPFLITKVSYQINPKFSVGVEAEGIYLSEDSALETGGFLNYRVSERWDFTAGYRYYARDIETSEIKNDVVYHGPYFGVAFSWL
jgi:membrane-associated phospholipid phosphatase